MAEGLLRHIAGDRFEVYSAGVRPSGVRQEAIEAMREIGIDISGQRSKSVDEFSGRDLDIVITVCDNARETCPIFPGKTVSVHKSFEDPPAPGSADPEEMMNAFRRVRDELWDYLIKFSNNN